MVVGIEHRAVSALTRQALDSELFLAGLMFMEYIEVHGWKWSCNAELSLDTPALFLTAYILF